MASIGGSNVVKSGLVLSLDAANARSYASGSTKCYNLIGTQPASFNGGASWDNTAGGAFTFSSASGQQYISTDTDVVVAPTDGITVEQWLYFPTSYSNMLSMYYRNATTIIASSINNSFETGFPSVKSYYSYTFDTGSWYHCVWTHSTSTNNARHFINNVTIYNQSPGTITIPATSSIFTIASNYSVPTRFDGKIAITRLYNRVLSVSEVAQNFNATKGRFNL
jgi:hypothetical protein